MSYFCLKINNFPILVNLKIIIRKKYVFNKLNKDRTSNNLLKY